MFRLKVYRNETLLESFNGSIDEVLKAFKTSYRKITRKRPTKEAVDEFVNDGYYVESSTSPSYMWVSNF